MNKWLNAIFGFSKKEQNGLLVLCILILLIVLLPAVFKAWVGEGVSVEDLKIEEQISGHRERLPESGDADPDLAEGVAAAPMHRTQSNDDDPSRRHVPKKLFPFNPNRLPAEQWRKLGLTDKQIRVIHNYESKGGSFRRKEDLQKMYSISESCYQELAPYVRIPAVEKPAFIYRNYGSEQRSAERKKDNSIIELNAADSASLVEVRGIGPVLASRIIQYRNRLGGYRDVAQLREVFGIDSLRYQDIFRQIRVDTAAIRKIYINRVGFDELRKFPYLRYKQMNAIIQYRKQHGKYSSIEDLTKINILDTEILRKIAPYLIFDD